MRPSLRIARIQVIILAVGFSAAWAQVELDKKWADRFAVKWSRVTYNRIVEIQNTGNSSPKQQTLERLSLSCDVEIRDPNLVLGLSREGVITDVTDSQGRAIDILIRPSQGQSYGGLQYREQLAQAKEPLWRSLARSALRLSPDQAAKPQWVQELQPSHLEMLLDLRSLDGAGRELGTIKGYFHVLRAESIARVEVLFEPNEAWVRLTPELEIQVREASCTASSFHFRIETRGPGMAFRPLSVGDPLPSRLVVARHFLGVDGKPTRHIGPYGQLPALVGGTGGGSGATSRIKAIRFEIAVNPTPGKVRFELQHVPLPDPNQSEHRWPGR